MLILSLDLGSTNLKAALFNERLNRLADVSLPTPYTVSGGVEFELDLAQIWDAVLDLIWTTCRRAGITPDQLSHVACGSQAQTFAFCNGFGTALTPFYSWLDGRAIAEAAVLQERLGDEFHRHCSFAGPVPQLQSAKAMWLRNHFPHLIRADTRLVPLPSFIGWKLTGELVTDDNVAAMGGLYSLARRGWWSEALELAGLRPEQMPRLVPVGTAVPAPAPCADMKMAPDLRFVCAGNDQTAGAVGNDCRRGDTIVTLGTALVAYRYAGEKAGPYTNLGCWGPFPGEGYYELATRDQGLIALDWARDTLMPGATTAAFLEHAREGWELGHHHVVRFQPHLMGSEAAWEGHGDLDEKALAVVSGINRVVRELLYQDLEIKPGELENAVVIGGGSRSDFWLQRLSVALGCSVRRGSGDSLLGAARMAVSSRQT